MTYNNLSPVSLSQKEFETTLKLLSEFKDPKLVRDQINILPKGTNSFSLTFTNKPRGFRKFCEKFYKPQHKRLHFVVIKTIEFLKAHEKFMVEGDNLQKLQSFQMRLFRVHKLRKKVSSATLNILDQLIKDTTTKKVQIATQTKEKNAREIQTITSDALAFQQKTVKETQEIASNALKSVAEIQKQIDEENKKAVEEKKQAIIELYRKRMESIQVTLDVDLHSKHFKGASTLSQFFDDQEPKIKFTDRLKKVEVSFYSGFFNSDVNNSGGNAIVISRVDVRRFGTLFNILRGLNDNKLSLIEFNDCFFLTRYLNLELQKLCHNYFKEIFQQMLKQFHKQTLLGVTINYLKYTKDFVPYDLDIRVQEQDSFERFILLEVRKHSALFQNEVPEEIAERVKSILKELEHIK